MQVPHKDIRTPDTEPCHQIFERPETAYLLSSGIRRIFACVLTISTAHASIQHVCVTYPHLRYVNEFELVARLDLTTSADRVDIPGDTTGLDVSRLEPPLTLLCMFRQS